MHTLHNESGPTDINIHIPAGIVALPDLHLIERVILNHIHERPRCSNDGLATLTGLTERGVEGALARLKRRGLIRSHGHGPARRLILMFPVKRHVECGENADTKSHTACGINQIENTHTECGLTANAEYLTNGGIQPEEIALDLPNFVAQEADAMNLCIFDGNFNQARTHFDRIRRRLVASYEKSPEKLEHPDECLRVFHHSIVILEAGWSGLSMLPGLERERLIGLLFKAGPERLAELRQQIEATTARGERVNLKLLIGD